MAEQCKEIEKNLKSLLLLGQNSAKETKISRDQRNIFPAYRDNTSPQKYSNRKYRQRFPKNSEEYSGNSQEIKSEHSQSCKRYTEDRKLRKKFISGNSFDTFERTQSEQGYEEDTGAEYRKNSKAHRKQENKYLYPGTSCLAITKNDLGARDVKVINNIKKDCNYKSYQKQPTHPKKHVIQEIKTQACIFKNAISSAIQVAPNEREKKEVHMPADEKYHIVQEDSQTDCSDTQQQVMIMENLNALGLRNQHENAIGLTQASVQTKSSSVSLIENPEKNLDSDDKFISTCNKPLCNCSESTRYCMLCDFHIDNEKELNKHRKNFGHQTRKSDYYRVEKLKELPQATENQLKTIEKLLQEIFSKCAQDSTELEQRTAVMDGLNSVLHSSLKECKIYLFGSSVNGFGLKSSDINIDLSVPQGISASEMLLTTHQILKSREDKYLNVSEDFSASIPMITFVDKKTKLHCRITLNNEQSRKTNLLFAQYAYFDERVRKLGVIFQYWAKICGIDRQEVCSLPPYCFPLMVIYFLQQHKIPVIPCFDEVSPPSSDASSSSPTVKELWKSQNIQSLAELWIELLKFYATEFKFREHVVCIRQRKPLLCSEKKWTTRMMCMEDPYSNKRNIARSIANQQWSRYIIECIRSTYEYFSTCQLPSDTVLMEETYEDDDEDSCQSLEENILDRFEDENDTDLDVESVTLSINRMKLENASINDNQKYRSHGKVEECGLPDHKQVTNKQKLPTNHVKQNTTNLSGLQQKNISQTLMYRFEKSYFIQAKEPPMFCRHCQKIGHVKQNCSLDDNLPELRKLPKMDNAHKELLTEVCETVFIHCKPKQEVEDNNRYLVSDLQRYISTVYPNAQLELFGSSCNGFGFVDSDLDICLTFLNETGEKLNQQEIIEVLTQKLREYRKILHVHSIPTAKVPIVKFSFQNIKKEGDISLYNTLGQYNTKLLSTYCKIDRRVQKLGYTLKYFAKVCDICDASRGSLSSYGYILMALFYLQQREPPVIPVLQELYDKSKSMPQRMVDGCNTWFFEDISNLENIWTEYGKNKESLGELWMGLLLFYTEKFKMNEFVICIRQKALLTRFEKLWNTKSISIEDPFDQNHNLGAGVSQKMNAFILATFRRAREQFGKIPPCRADIPNIIEYFFNRKVFTDGKNPPNERGCRFCCKIGHKMAECPLRYGDNNRWRKRKNNFRGRRKSGDKWNESHEEKQKALIDKPPQENSDNQHYQSRRFQRASTYRKGLINYQNPKNQASFQQFRGKPYRTQNSNPTS